MTTVPHLFRRWSALLPSVLQLQLLAGPSSAPTTTTFIDLSGLPGSISHTSSVSPPMSVQTGATMLGSHTTATVVTTGATGGAPTTQFTTTSPVTVTMFSHGSGGNGMGGGLLYHQPPPSNLFLSSSTSSLAHQAGLDEAGTEDVKPVLGVRDVLYR